MDSRTIQYYAEHVRELAARYEGAESTAALHARTVFPPGGRILEVGFGSGRDLQALLDEGFDMEGVDACEGFLIDAIQQRPHFRGRVGLDRLPELSTVADGSFDGVLCWAVLMHVPKEEVLLGALHLRRVLRPKGRLLISTPLAGPHTDPRSDRAGDGRLFNGVTPGQFRLLFERVGFRQLHRWDSPDALGRPERTWSTQAFARESTHSVMLEPIDSILKGPKEAAR